MFIIHIDFALTAGVCRRVSVNKCRSRPHPRQFSVHVEIISNYVTSSSALQTINTRSMIYERLNSSDE